MKYFSSLRTRLQILILIGTIPVSAVLIYSDYRNRELRKQEAEYNIKNLNKLALADINRYLENANQFLATISQTNEIQNGNPGIITAYFKKIHKYHPEFANIAMAGVNGNIVSSAVQQASPVKVSDRFWFKHALETKKFSIGGYQTGRIVGFPVMVFGYPVFDGNNELKGVISVAMDIKWMSSFGKDINRFFGSVFTVIDRNGTIVSRYPDNEKWMGNILPESSLIKAALDGRSFVEIEGIDNVKRFYIIDKVDAEGSLYVVVGVPGTVIYKELNKWLLIDIFLMIIAVALGILLMRFAGREFIQKPINTIINTAGRLKDGNLSARTGVKYNADEFGYLAEKIDEMADKIENFVIERGKMEISLNNAKRLLEIIFDHTYIMVAYLDTEFNFVKVNRAYAIADNRDTEFFPGKNHFTLYPNAENEAIFREVIKSGTPHFEFAKPFEYAEHPERGITYWDWSLVPIKDANGALIGLILTLLNVTERIKTGFELRESEEKYRNLVERSTDGVIIIQDKLLKYVNPAAEKMTGYKSEVLINTPFVNYLHPGERSKVVDYYVKRMAGSKVEQRYNTVIMHKDGGGLDVEIDASVTMYKGKQADFVYIRNITERKKVEEDLLILSKFPFEDPNPVFRISSEGGMLYKNPAAGKLLQNAGLSEKDIMKILPDNLLFLINKAMKTKIPIKDLEVGIDDKVYSYTMAPVIEQNYVNLYGTDITERKKVELMKDNLIRDVSHELKTPIALIEMANDICFQGIKENNIGQVKKTQDIIFSNIKRLHKDVDSILEMFLLKREKILNKVYFSTDRLIKNVVKNTEYLAHEKGLKLTVDIAENVDKIFIDEKRMKIVLNNILDNAIKFTNHGKIGISARLRGKWIRIAVKDTGCGISQEIRENMFGRFYKRHSAVPGTGLGLSICKEIIEMHNGKIKIFSKGENKGAIVAVYLPVE